MYNKIKNVLSKIIPKTLWGKIRLQLILCNQRRTAKICHDLIDRYHLTGGEAILNEVKPRKVFNTDRILWQYWAQGYDSLPEVVDFCLKSVDSFNSGCEVIRLCDSNISEYLDLPDYVLSSFSKFGRPFYSDLLRVILLYYYGGVWLDATVLLTASLPDRYFEKELFLFQRDPEEKHKDYWEKSFAYYFGWSKRFRVNMLSSVLFAQKQGAFISTLCGMMLFFSREYEKLPDYFMFQILYDVLSKGEMASHRCEIESDCLPHYLMQICNDSFPYATVSETLLLTGIHKLSYKEFDFQKLKLLLV